MYNKKKSYAKKNTEKSRKRIQLYRDHGYNPPLIFMGALRGSRIRCILILIALSHRSGKPTKT